MDPQVESQLLQLNRSFYERFARQFADSRSTSQASLRRVLVGIADGDAVLDVGCGDGRAARALAEMGRRVSYAGVDGSEALLALARHRATGLVRVTATFQEADVAQAGWQNALTKQRFNAVLGLAVLHHIPGAARRQRLVADMAALLAPGGMLVMSTWQFMASERLRRKVVPWATAGLADTQVDEGDYLLDWQRGGYGLRYCRLIGEDELGALCQEAGLQVTEVFLADGGLNLFAIAQQP